MVAVTGPWFLDAGREARVDRKIPCFRVESFPWKIHTSARAVKAGSLGESVGVWAGLQEARFLSPRWRPLSGPLRRRRWPPRCVCRSASQSQRREADIIPARLLLQEPGDFRGKSGPPAWLVAQGCPVYARHTRWTNSSLWLRVMQYGCQAASSWMVRWSCTRAQPRVCRAPQDVAEGFRAAAGGEERRWRMKHGP